MKANPYEEARRMLENEGKGTPPTEETPPETEISVDSIITTIMTFFGKLLPLLKNVTEDDRLPDLRKTLESIVNQLIALSKQKGKGIVSPPKEPEKISSNRSIYEGRKIEVPR